MNLASGTSQQLSVFIDAITAHSANVIFVIVFPETVTASILEYNFVTYGYATQRRHIGVRTS